MVAANTSAVLPRWPAEAPFRRSLAHEEPVSLVMMELEASARQIRGVLIYTEPPQGFAGYDLPWEQ